MCINFLQFHDINVYDDSIFSSLKDKKNLKK